MNISLPQPKAAQGVHKIEGGLVPRAHGLHDVEHQLQGGAHGDAQCGKGSVWVCRGGVCGGGECLDGGGSELALR